MKLRDLNEKQHAMLSAALLLIMILLLGSILVYPAISKRSVFNEQFEELQFQYNRFSQLVTQRDKIISDLEELRQNQMDASGFLEDEQESLAAADLSSHLKGIIESNGGNLISTQPVQQDSKGTFPDVTIKIHMRADIDSLQEIFYALEAYQTTLLIDNLYLQKRNARSTRSRASRFRNRNTVQEEMIETRFDVIAYIYREEPAS